jgi:hypothetical protein
MNIIASSNRDTAQGVGRAAVRLAVHYAGIVNVPPLPAPGNAPAQHVQRHLHCEDPNALAVAEELAGRDVGSGGIGNRHVHRARRRRSGCVKW